MVCPGTHPPGPLGQPNLYDSYEQDKEVLIEFVMLPRKTYNPKLNPTNKKHKMTKVAGKWRQSRVLRELRYRTITFLYLFSLKKKKNQKQINLSLGRVWLNIF